MLPNQSLILPRKYICMKDCIPMLIQTTMSLFESFHGQFQMHFIKSPCLVTTLETSKDLCEKSTMLPNTSASIRTLQRKWKGAQF